jgi:hypothetical protein
MVVFLHCGLFFTDEHIQQARQMREREPFKTAWTFLLQQEQTGALASAQSNALRYRFNDDLIAGKQAVRALLDLDTSGKANSAFASLASLLTLAQIYEMLRDHSAFQKGERERWLDDFAAQVTNWNDSRAVMTYSETLWLGALNTAAGIVPERADWLETGAEIYRRTVQDDIRPEGYLPNAVEGKDGRSLYRQLLSVKALVLIAEMASHVGLDLWNYASRGVSVMTACAYLLFYYYYPEKWRWEPISEPDTRRLFREHGGFLEMVNRQARPKDAKLMLDDLRPIYDMSGGGLTTLSHGVPARRGLLG